MENFVTIKTFSYAHEFPIIRARLEAEGIECRVLDELTVQTTPYYSNAIGGIKLQVKEEDVANAIKILEDAGYKREMPVDPGKSLEKFENLTNRIPFLRRISPVFRALTLLGFFFVLITVAIYIYRKPSLTQTLHKGYWCLDHITFNDKVYQPDTEKGFRMDKCNEAIFFQGSNVLILPGFNSHATTAKWSLTSDQLIISNCDTFGFLYNGNYKVKLSGDDLFLASETTFIYCSHIVTH